MLEWSLTALGLAGAAANVLRRRWGFALWLVADAGWMAVSIARGSVAEATLWAVYGLLAAWGWWAWGERGAAFTTKGTKDTK